MVRQPTKKEEWANPDMHTIEPHYHWIDLYSAAEDDRSPFYGREYSEFEFTNSIYNFLIHPQWDDFGSETLYIKLLFVDYEHRFAIIEMMGEWNDAIGNDIMRLKSEVVDILIDNGICHFILIGENVLNFHPSDDCYYEEWFQELEDGWIAAINFREHVREDFESNRIDYYLNFGGEFDSFNWRKYRPNQLFSVIHQQMMRRLNPPNF
jgi:hypothetical protein